MVFTEEGDIGVLWQGLKGCETARQSDKGWVNYTWDR